MRRKIEQVIGAHRPINSPPDRLGLRAEIRGKGALSRRCVSPGNIAANIMPWRESGVLSPLKGIPSSAVYPESGSPASA